MGWSRAEYNVFILGDRTVTDTSGVERGRWKSAKPRRMRAGPGMTGFSHNEMGSNGIITVFLYIAGEPTTRRKAMATKKIRPR